MSDTEMLPEGAAEGETLAPVELAMPLASFARLVGPTSTTRTSVVRGRQVQAQSVVPGTPEEVWLRLLAVRHPNERHTITQWRALIARYAMEQAHPSHPDFGKVS